MCYNLNMYTGQVQHQIDEKLRIRIPTKFKEGLGANPFISVGTNNCLFVYSYEDAHKIFIDRFKDSDFTDYAKMQAIRMIMPNAIFAQEDNQGRILLPQHLISHAQIKKNIITIGAFDHVEIWSEENWLSYNENKNFDDVIKQLKQQNQ